MFQNIIDGLKGNPKKEDGVKIKGSIVLMKKNVLDFNDLNASLLDRIAEAFGKRVSFQLISAVAGDPGETFFWPLISVLIDVWWVMGELEDSLLVFHAELPLLAFT